MLGCYKTFDCKHERPTRVRKRTLRERPLLDVRRTGEVKHKKPKHFFWWDVILVPTNAYARGAAYSRWAPYNTTGCARFVQYPCWPLAASYTEKPLFSSVTVFCLYFYRRRGKGGFVRVYTHHFGTVPPLLPFLLVPASRPLAALANDMRIKHPECADKCSSFFLVWKIEIEIQKEVVGVSVRYW